MHALPLDLPQVPILQTERLILRGHRRDDFAESAVMWGDPAVTRYIRREPFSREESWSRFLRYLGHWSLLGFGYWVVEERATGRFAGEVGFADYKRDLEPSLEGTPEAGWVLASHAHGKGYAAEALRKLVSWGDEHFGPVPTACIIDPENLPSISVAEKCGYRQTQPTTYKGDRILLFMREPGAR
jgi:RimJ/RimL family protein N-acetyltransferase